MDSFLNGVIVPKYGIESRSTFNWKKLDVKSLLMTYLNEPIFRKMSLHLVTLDGGKRQNLPISLKAVTYRQSPLGFLTRKLGEI